MGEMGNMEAEVRKEVRQTRVHTAIIGTLAVGGTLAFAVLAPNVFQVLKWAGFSHRRTQTVNKSLQRLVDRGYIVKKEGKLHLTAKGERFAALLGEGRLAPVKPRRWDRKWRLLAFDIPERRKRSRERMRLTLLQLGFHRLQDSVWVYPYDCEDFIQLLKTDLRIGRDLIYIIADQIENDRALRTHFNLK